MSEQKHSPAPWRMSQPSMGYSSLYDACGKFVFALAAPADGSKSVAEIEANAALIAAAPELREACRSAMEAIRDNLAMRTYKNEPLLLAAFNKCEAAIRKATT